MESSIVDLIDDDKRKSFADDEKRSTSRRIGASSIGDVCSRRIWLDFRMASNEPFNPDRAELQRSGNMLEKAIINDMLEAGLHVNAVSPDGGQWNMSWSGGHCVARPDAFIKNSPEFPGKYAVVDIKCISNDSAEKIRHSDELMYASTTYYAQLQVLMLLFNVKRGLLFVRNNATGSRFTKQVEFNREMAEMYEEKGKALVARETPPEILPPDLWDSECGNGRSRCRHYDLCHGTRAPAVNCRTCIRCRPKTEGDGGEWECSLSGEWQPIDFQVQKKGCDNHAYIPELLEHFADCILATDDGEFVYKHRLSGNTFSNPPNGNGVGYSSIEIHAIEDTAGLDDSDEVRNEFSEVFNAKVIAPIDEARLTEPAIVPKFEKKGKRK